MDVYELAKKYYPTLWNIDRLRKLVEVGKLTPEQFKEITDEEYAET